MDLRLSFTKTLPPKAKMEKDEQFDVQLFKIMKEQIPEYQKSVKSLSSKITHLTSKLNFQLMLKENIDKVKEEKLGLEHRLSLMDDLVKENAKLKMEIGGYQEEKKEWTKFLDNQENAAGTASNDKSSSISRSSPLAMAQDIFKLNNEVCCLKEELGSLKANEAFFKTSTGALNQKIDELQNSLAKKDIELGVSKKSLLRQKLATQLSQKELGYLKESLRCYDLEEKQLNPNFDTLKAQRILDMENTLEAYKHDWASLQEKPGTEASTPRILQLRQNPESQIVDARKEVIDSLRTENAKLLDQLNFISSNVNTNTPYSNQSTSSNSTTSAIPQETFNRLTEDLKALRKDLSSKETLILRLKEVFGKKIQGYRQFVQSALGYQCEMEADDVTFKLVSILNQSFAFQIDSTTGEIRCSSHADQDNLTKGLLEFYVSKHGFIPAFLSKITLSLFESHLTKK